MATIEITRPHTLSKDEARKRAEELARSMEEKLSIVWRWEGDTIRFDAPSGTAKGTKGHVAVTDTAVSVSIDLPFMLRVMKGAIESKVNDKLSQVL